MPATRLSVTPPTAEGTSVDVSATFELPRGGPSRMSNWPRSPRRLARDRGAGLPAGAVRRPDRDGTWRFTGGPAGTTDLPWPRPTASAATPRPGRCTSRRRASAFVPPPAPTGTAQVSGLPFLASSNGWGPVERDRSNGDTDEGDGHPLTIAGTRTRTAWARTRPAR